MADTIQFLNEEYVPLGETMWISPELAEKCASQTIGLDPSKDPFYLEYP
jgi:hypothetical protein